jgi:hypothetical protein
MRGNHVLEQYARAGRAQTVVTRRACARARGMWSTCVSATHWAIHTGFAAASVRQAGAVLVAPTIRARVCRQASRAFVGRCMKQREGEMRGLEIVAAQMGSPLELPKPTGDWRQLAPC